MCCADIADDWEGWNRVILSTTASWARTAMSSNRDLIAQSLAYVITDVMKIVDSVTSFAWRIPSAVVHEVFVAKPWVRHISDSEKTPGH